MRVSRFHGLKLQTRILVSFVPILVVAIAVVVLVVDVRKTQVMLDLSRDRGLAVARSLEAASSRELLSYNYVALQQLSERAIEEEGVRYVIILDKEGLVAGYSGRPDWQGKRLDDLISLSAASSRKTVIQKISDRGMGAHDGLDIAVPVYVEGSPQKWGTVRVGLSLESVYREVTQARIAVLGLALLVLALSFVAARVLARRITGPLGRLVQATAELSRGNYDFKVGLKTGDEIGNLAERFDQMAREIRRQQDEVESKNHELAALNASLESKVEERTRALVEAEEKYRILVENSPNPICIIQGEHLVFANRAFSETFGYSREELGSPGFSFLGVVDPGNRARFAELCSTVMVGGEDEDLPTEMVGLHRDGKQIYLDIRSTWITYRGTPALEAILVDVTDQRELQEKVVSYERLRALGEMASGVAHDFNNCLGTILARSQYLQHKTGEEEVLRGLKIIEKAAEDGGETVRRIQDFSRVRTDRNFGRVDLNEVLEDVVEMTRTRWEDEAQKRGKKIELHRDFGEGAVVEGNLHELRESFTNLVLNAVDAIPGDGSITVATARSNGMAEVVIRDSGLGMSLEVQRKLFDPFFSTKGVKGTGLGMSIVYGIITRHEGTIDVESAPDRGTTFRIRFPAVEGSASTQARASRENPGILRGTGRILVVDDEPELRTLAADILTDAGYEVHVAGSGPDALELARQMPFHIVLTDLGMPEMSGWEVARRVRELLPEVRTMLLTGWGATLDPAEVKANGIERTMQKPFRMEDLLRAISELMEEVGSRSSRAA